MRYGIFSDVHSNLEALQAVIRALAPEQIDQYLCIGDIVGYAARPKECIREVKGLGAKTVAGNHDQAAVGLYPDEYFNDPARTAILWTRLELNNEEAAFLRSLELVYRNPDLTIVHGTLDNPQEFSYLMDKQAARESMKILQTQVCFIGHTHIPAVFVQNKNNRIEHFLKGSVTLEPGNKYIINIGSVGQPRDGDPRAAYCIYDTVSATVLIKRAEYPVKITRGQIHDSGLPEFLGERLLSGH